MEVAGVILTVTPYLYRRIHSLNATHHPPLLFFFYKFENYFFFFIGNGVLFFFFGSLSHFSFFTE